MRIDGVVGNVSSCFPTNFIDIRQRAQSNSIQGAGSIFEGFVMIEC